MRGSEKMMLGSEKVCGFEVDIPPFSAFQSTSSICTSYARIDSSDNYILEINHSNSQISQ